MKLQLHTDTLSLTQTHIATSSCPCSARSTVSHAGRFPAKGSRRVSQFVWRFPKIWYPNSWIVYSGKSQSQLDDLRVPHGTPVPPWKPPYATDYGSFPWECTFLIVPGTASIRKRGYPVISPKKIQIYREISLHIHSSPISSHVSSMFSLHFPIEKLCQAPAWPPASAGCVASRSPSRIFLKVRAATGGKILRKSYRSDSFNMENWKYPKWLWNWWFKIEKYN